MLLARGGRLQHRGELRHPDAGDDARGADAARADADLHRIDASLDQRASPLGRRDIAGDDLGGVGRPLDGLDGSKHAHGVAVGGVYDDDVGLGRDQCAGTGLAVRSDAGGGGDSKAAKLVLVGERVGFRLVHVLDGDQADAAIAIVDNDQLLDPVLVQQVPGAFGADIGGDRDEVLPRHQLIHFQTGFGGEAHIAVGDDADQAVGIALDHRNAADAMGRHQRLHIGQGLVRVDGQRVHHHARLVFLDPADLGRLLLGR